MEKVSDRFIEQLLALRRGQHLKLHLEDGPIPDFHSEDNVYEVTKTVVTASKEAEENFFKIFLGSDHVEAARDPVCKLTVSRNVPDKIGRTRPDGQWNNYWLNARTGKTGGETSTGNNSTVTQRTSRSSPMSTDARSVDIRCNRVR